MAANGLATTADAPASLRQALRPLRFALVAAMLFSLGINLMMLVSPLYLMQVFDRVLSSGSLHTLMWLSLLALGCLAVYGALDAVRSRVLSRLGLWLECEVTGRLIRRGVADDGSDARPLRDLGQIRGFLSSPAVNALFDAPWALLFLAVLWLLHPWYGVFATAAMAALLGIAAAGELLTRRLSHQAGAARAAAFGGAEVALRNAEVVRAMGMTGAVLERWSRHQAAAADRQDGLDGRASALSGLSRFLRIAVQVAVIAIGAVLVLRNEATAGGMIAASVLMGRALAPVDQAIGGWKQLVAVRTAWRRVDAALWRGEAAAPATRLAPPAGRLTVEDATLHFDGAGEPALKAISLDLDPGDSLAIVGPSAAGKTLLCKLLCGILAPSRGHVRIDHADLRSWREEDLRPHIGYLPQEIALFPGTVSENIARLSDAPSEAVIAAAKLADVHELILRLPDGYDTDVGAWGHLLSGGQRQRIGLARAVFGDPRLVVLDEPNSNLDPAGETALLGALAALERRGCTVVVVSHKLAIVQNLDRTLLLRDGAVQAFGPSGKVLSILMEASPAERPARPDVATAPALASRA